MANVFTQVIMMHGVNVRTISLRLTYCCCQHLSKANVSSKTGSELEKDVIVPVEAKADIIGPPDAVSNLRPIRFHIPTNESAVEKQYRLKREEVQKWSQEFWTRHNTSFFKEKDLFLKSITQGEEKGKGVKKPVSADEMSVFYKAFLDKNWKFHVNYNIEWYKRNIELLWLALKVKLNKVRTKTS